MILYLMGCLISYSQVEDRQIIRVKDRDLNAYVKCQIKMFILFIPFSNNRQNNFTLYCNRLRVNLSFIASSLSHL